MLPLLLGTGAHCSFFHPACGQGRYGYGLAPVKPERDPHGSNISMDRAVLVADVLHRDHSLLYETGSGAFAPPPDPFRASSTHIVGDGAMQNTCQL